MKKLLIIAAMGALVLSSCEEKEQPNDKNEIELGNSIEFAVTLDQDNIAIPMEGEAMLNATVFPEDSEEPIVWLSNKSSIATVSEDGVVTGHEAGEAIIVAVVGEASAICHVNVFRPITELSIGTDLVQILRRETFLLQPQFLPHDATEIIKWSSSDTDVATVDENGLVTGVKEGQAVITAQCCYTSAQCTVEVQAVHATDISISGPTEIWLGHEEPLTATLTPSNSTDDIEWSTSAPEIASVDENGVVKGLALGEATVTASIGELSTSIQIEIIPVPVKEIVLNPSPLAFTEIGQTIQLTATVLPEDAADKSFVWSVDNPDIASIDSDGTVTALAGGNTCIHATATNGVVANADVRVSAPRALPYNEDFESYNNENIREDWYFIDADGDGNGWMHNQPDYDSFSCHSGSGILTSASYINYVGKLTPDNWAFTPPIQLDAAGNKLSYWLAAQDHSYVAEHFAVYISTEITTTGGTMLYEGTLVSYDYWEFSSDIPEEFNGKVVYIAFRHFNCSDMYWIDLDDISITSSSSVTPVDPDPEEPVPAIFIAPRTNRPGDFTRR